MAERFNQRQDTLARELGERMLDSEERAGARVTEAINSIMERLAEVEEHSAEAIAPVQKAVSSVATKLEQFENAHEPASSRAPAADAIPTPTRRQEDFPIFGDIEEVETYVSPMNAAQPTRAAPLPPRTPAPQPASEEEIYFSEGIDDLLEDEAQMPPIEIDDAPLAASATRRHAPIELAQDTDLVIDEPFLDDIDLTAPPPASEHEENTFWSPDTETGAIPLAGAQDAPFGSIDSFGDAPNALPLTAPAEPEQPPGKNDYLANARKAAQAQAEKANAKEKKVKEPKQKQAKAPKVKAEKSADSGAAPQLSLRGSSRIVLWGATGLIVLALVAGARYFADSQSTEPGPTSPEAEPPAATDPSASLPAPSQDPFAEAPVEGMAPDGAVPAVEGTPVAENGATVAPVVAAPLAPRNVSLEQAAQSGDLTAQYELGLQRLASGRAAEGATLLRRAADRGFAMAQYRLAKLYERGEGVPADLTFARQWTERAAASGNRRAMHDLGVFFARGEGAPLDESAAFRWFRQAAELGVADSQYNLGVLYQQGRGVNASGSEALFWFMVAARQGDRDAAARATALEAQLTPAQVEQARARAQAFRPRAANAVANGEFGPRAWAARPAT
jgi:localization factor PodJL